MINEPIINYDTYTHYVPIEYVGLIIGVGGKTIQMIKEQSGCESVKICQNSDPGDPQRKVIIVGTQEAAIKCKQMLQEIVDNLTKARNADGVL